MECQLTYICARMEFGSASFFFPEYETSLINSSFNVSFYSVFRTSQMQASKSQINFRQSKEGTNPFLRQKKLEVHKNSSYIFHIGSTFIYFCNYPSTNGSTYLFDAYILFKYVIEFYSVYKILSMV